METECQLIETGTGKTTNEIVPSVKDGSKPKQTA
jgi:hypothetical protein